MTSPKALSDARLLENSNRRIAIAKKTLEVTPRGNAVLDDLRCFLNRDASGLDTEGLKALEILVHEFCVNHRRGF